MLSTVFVLVIEDGPFPKLRKTGGVYFTRTCFDCVHLCKPLRYHYSLLLNHQSLLTFTYQHNKLFNSTDNANSQPFELNDTEIKAEGQQNRPGQPVPHVFFPAWWFDGNAMEGLSNRCKFRKKLEFNVAENFSNQVTPDDHSRNFPSARTQLFYRKRISARKSSVKLIMVTERQRILI